MGLADWLRVFRALHERAKKGELQGADALDYRDGCDELARALMAAQKISPKPDERPLHALRVARALQVTLESPGSSVRTMTVEFSARGFSALLAKAPGPGDDLTAIIRMPGESPISAAVTAAESKLLGGTVRVTFLFQDLADPERTRLERLVIDTALSNLAG